MWFFYLFASWFRSSKFWPILNFWPTFISLVNLFPLTHIWFTTPFSKQPSTVKMECIVHRSFSLFVQKFLIFTAYWHLLCWFSYRELGDNVRFFCLVYLILGLWGDEADSWCRSEWLSLVLCEWSFGLCPLPFLFLTCVVFTCMDTVLQEVKFYNFRFEQKVQKWTLCSHCPDLMEFCCQMYDSYDVC